MSRARLAIFGFLEDNQKDDAPGYEIYTLLATFISQYLLIR